MKIAFYKAEHGTWLDKLIALATFSKYSHCEIQFSDGMCGSSSIRDNGAVRFKNINLDSGHWDVFEFDHDWTEKYVRYCFTLFENEMYDYIGAFFSTFYLDVGLDNRKYCSEICGFAASAPPGLSPGALYRYLRNNRKLHAII